MANRTDPLLGNDPDSELWNITGTSKVLPWPLQWPPKDRFADGKPPSTMPFIGEVVSEYLIGTAYQALVRRAELARQHRSSDFTAVKLAR